MDADKLRWCIVALEAVLAGDGSEVEAADVLRRVARACERMAAAVDERGRG
jgi:hypothetical protein